MNNTTCCYMLAALSLIVMQSCSHKSGNIDDIVKEYDTVNFSAFKDRFIFFRSGGSGRSTSIYFLHVFGMDKQCIYTIEYNHPNDSIIEIGHTLFQDSVCQDESIGNEEIERIVKTFVKYRIPTLGVDREGDVYMNPYAPGPSVFLRKSPTSTSTSKNRRGFTLYKGNWYVDMDEYNKYRH